MSRFPFALSLSIFLLSIGISQAQTPLIQDQSYLDPTFVDFRLRLSEAILHRDTTLLKPLLADTVAESQNGYAAATPSQFLAYLFSENNSEASWDLMAQVVRFGFRRFRAGENSWRGVPIQTLCFQAPSFHQRFESDSFLLVLGENVNIRQAPGMQATILNQVSYALLRCDCTILTLTDQTIVRADGRRWHQVYLPDGRQGYVAYSLTSTPVIRELTVAKLDGAWKIVSFFKEPGC